MLKSKLSYPDSGQDVPTLRRDISIAVERVVKQLRGKSVPDRTMQDFVEEYDMHGFGFFPYTVAEVAPSEFDEGGVWCNTLSGSSGEWTNEDDRSNNVKQVRRQLNRIVDQATGVNVSRLAGSAKAVYKMVAGQRRVRQNRTRKSAPVAYGSATRVGRPRTRDTARGHIVTHREYLGEVNGSTTFSITEYKIQPGSSAYVWLSNMAQAYKQYRVKRWRIEYTPFSSSAAAGSFLFAPSYDPTDSTPTTKSEIMQKVGGYCGNIWMRLDDNEKKVDYGELDVGLLHARANLFYVRTSEVPDVLLYDAGKFYVGASGTASADPIGDLWVEYELEMVTPIQGDIAYTPSSVTYYQNSTAQTLATGVGEIVDLTEVYNNCGWTSNAGVYTLPKGGYLVYLNVGFADNTNEAYTAQLQLRESISGTVYAAAIVEGAAVASGPSAYLNIMLVIVSDGSQTLTPVATMTGAAGTLTLPGSGTTSIANMIVRCV